MIRIPFFKTRPHNFLGVDIGTSGIKITELSHEGKILKLKNYGELILSFEKKPFRTAKKENLFLSDQEAAQIIQDIMKEAEIRTKDANFSIPDFCSFFTNFKLPPMSKEELPQAISYEARSYIPLSLSEITLDWAIVGDQDSNNEKNSFEIIAVAIPNEIVNQYQKIASLSGLKLKTLESEVFSLSRALSRKEKIIGLIDLGASTTTINILKKGTLKMSHSFNIAGNELTNALVNALSVEYQKAEDLKKLYGLTSSLKHNNIKESLLPLIDGILAEIKKIFQTFYQSEDKEVEAIILSGGTALLPGLKEYFFEQFKKEIIIADPFSDLSSPQILTEILKERGPAYSIAAGLALKGFE